MGRLDWAAFETRLAHWVEALLAHYPAADDTPLAAGEAIAVDGKTWRGSKQQGAPLAHLLTALSHRFGLTLAQLPVASHSHEIGVILDLLATLFLQGKILTFDVLLTQRKVAKAVINEGGDG